MPRSRSTLVVGSLGLGIVALLTLRAIRSIGQRLLRVKYTQITQHDLYEDEDGVATEQSVKDYAAILRWLLYGTTLLTAVGIGLSLSIAVLGTSGFLGTENLLMEHWFDAAAWGLLGLNSIAMLLECSPLKTYGLSVFGFLASSATLATPALELWIVSQVSEKKKLFDPTHLGLFVAQFAVGLALSIVYLSVPRRPDVFFQDKLVDRQYSGSLLHRVTFGWADRLLKFAIRNQSLEIDNLNSIDSTLRSKGLHTNFEAIKGSMPLWRLLLKTYWPTILLQYILTFLYSFAQIAPQIALFGLLRSLEDREIGQETRWRTWQWVIGLGVFDLTACTIDCYLYWVVYTRLAMPIKQQIAAFVFAKAMRRKDVKEAAKPNSKPDDVTDNDSETDTSSGADSDDEAGLGKTRQSVVNLVVVDADCVSDAVQYNHMLASSILELAIACTFLVKLLGWKPTLSGLSIAVIVLPVNFYTAKKFANAQTSLMKYRDQKVAVLTEVLQGIRQIKFSALESSWQRKVSEAREQELGAQWKVLTYDIGLLTIWLLGPIMLSAISLGVYASIHGQLTASTAFTAMSVFETLEVSFAVLPELISDFVEAWVSLGRLDKHLDAPEKLQVTVPSDVITLENASVAWPVDDDEACTEERFVLRNLNIDFPDKGLTVISGKTGSGKSLLLATILGEADILDGTVRVPQPPPIENRHDGLANSSNWLVDSAIAYVSQTPWIENASVRDNILFGLPHDGLRYDMVLSACALNKDLDMLVDGDLTDIGINGINLSGGQKWRVSFARALYSRASILVMDDIFSAVDAHTGRHLFEQALTGELGQGRTRILVTHHVGLCLPRTDYAVFMAEDSVRCGTIEKLKKSDSLASLLLSNKGEESTSETTIEVDDPSLAKGSTPQRKLSAHHPQIEPGTDNLGNEMDRKPNPKKFMEDETRATGSIKREIYTRYVKTGGNMPFWLAGFSIAIVYQMVTVGRSWWLNIWTAKSQPQETQYSIAIQQPIHQQVISSKTTSLSVTTLQDDSLMFYLSIYILLSVFACVIGSLRYSCILYASLRASRSLFDELTFAVLRAPLRWLDTVPVGRILNRFTSDFRLLDSSLGYNISFATVDILEVCGIVVAGTLVSPWLIIIAIVLFFVYLHFARLYLAGAREIKRLESNAKSPVLEQFGSALTGLGTIRAFTKTNSYINRMYGLIDRHMQAWYYLRFFNQWLRFRLSVIGSVFSMVSAMLVVSVPGTSASLAGFALSFSLQYTSVIEWALRHYADLELEMNAAERVVEYTNIVIEDQGGQDAPASWPTEGTIEVEDLVVAYAPDLPPVLKGLNFRVEQNQRVGVVGRTGAGKSSLTLALFRFLEIRQGRIIIDGIDVSTIKLHDLRSRLAIIPQDPVLFSGTIRSNLDPFSQSSDTELYEALERVHLMTRADTSEDDPPAGSSTPISSSSSTAIQDSTNANVFESLDSPISEGGLNLSQGQRQLLCLARAIVSRPKIMVLDEATSAVDMDTDALIQRSIRSEFGRNATTLLVIAHRLSTIADFDRILVMDAGKVVEFGAPRDLMGIEGGVFRSLVEESGERKTLEEVIFS
ncbi:hypothetical protein PISL3812_08165 [Talaromyces islandicus]|uniref:ATP-dependent bile acid permease n=1 Tax=Talaromyces islandicus TaxID=28573 RepID=A0A0U1M6G3_TALIS|nr:hypothetical protein PISL3812_08165 [Talaromyces islandicus]